MDSYLSRGNYITFKNVSDHGFEPNGIRYISEDKFTHETLNCKGCGDVLISITGYLGRLVRYDIWMLEI